MRKINQWKFKTKSIAYIKSTTFKTKTSYVKVSFISIILGLLCGIIFLYCFGMNGFGFIFSSLIKPFTSPVEPEGTVILLAVFILLGLGLALGFRIKLFNMGGSGQAIGGLLITYLFLNAVTGGSDFSNLPGGYGILLFLIFIVSGAIVSSLTGILKVLFNIHEVATSIVINWILWYLLKYVLFIKFDTQLNSPNLPEVFGSQLWVFAIIFALVSIVLVFVVCETTTVGYKYKVVGTQSTAAKYAGIKTNSFIIGVTALQGVFISAAGFFYYFGLKSNISVTNDIMPLLGFDGIPIALVAFNNFLGIIPVAILWAVLKDGIQLTMNSPQYMGLPSETSDLLFGIIILFSTMYLLLMKINISNYVNIIIHKIRDPKFKTEIEIINSDIKELKKEKNILILNLDSTNEKLKIKELKKQIQNKSENLEILRDELNSLTNEYKENKAFQISKIKNKIKDLKLEKHLFINKELDKYNEHSIKGLKKVYEGKYNSTTFPILDQVVSIESEIQNIKESLSNSNIKEQEKLIAKKNKLELKAASLINKQESQIKYFKNNFASTKQEAKTYLNDLKLIYKKEIKELEAKKGSRTFKKLKIRKLKIDLLEKQMEVVKIYGSNI
ncbi:ribose ABC transporter permease component [Mesoplasma florum L1]|uniref:Ribose ABC transporter permease component n=1 Tax=Mesoplasma florum (strain ATCC 33453 / NBRC 100688 / NCTC 11704 / L1) TaxID=265311 RepID=Q6F0F0_MESFL|nr:ABC transporter permease [Mesoplasma florum]AAT76023.1 ribose ABC transporter permease component [Mesoplasma florum L1]